MSSEAMQCQSLHKDGIHTWGCVLDDGHAGLHQSVDKVATWDDSPPAPVVDPLASAVSVLEKQLDPKRADPSDADFKAAVATLLLDTGA